MCRKVEEGKMENNASGKSSYLSDCKRDKITRDLWLNMVNQAKKKKNRSFISFLLLEKPGKKFKKVVCHPQYTIKKRTI